MSSAQEQDEIAKLRAQLREVERRLEERERDGARTEQRHQQAEQLFSALFDESPEAIALSRLADGVVVNANREWLHLTGCQREEIVGHEIVKLGQWPDPAEHQAMVTQLHATGALRGCEAAVHLKERGKCLLQFTASVMDVSGVAHVLTYLKDVTAGRMAEESVRLGEESQKRLNAQLRQQVGLHEFTEKLARVGYWMASSDGETVTWSRGLREIAGVSDSPGTRSLMQARSLVHPDDLPKVIAYRKRMDGEPFEYRLRRADGATRWLRTELHRLQDSEGRMLDFGIVQDITVEHEARQALRERFNFIHKLTSRVPGVLYQYQRRADGTVWFPYISDSVQRVFGVAPQEVQRDARQFFKVIDPADIPSLFESMRLAHFDEGAWQHDFRVRRDDGEVRWVHGDSITLREADGELVSYGSLIDITERKLAEARLQESEARFRSLTDLSSDWYWEIDEHFRFTDFVGYSNRKSLLSRDDSLGRTRWELGALNFTEEDWESHRKVLESHQPFRDLELQRLDAVGKAYWVSVSGAPIFDAEGRFRGYRGIGRDISMRKQAEDETQRLAFYDTLTGLPNRRLLMDRLAHAQGVSARSQHHGALLFIDLDNFKDLNDTLGHDVGDQLLEQVALRLVSCVREGDTAARFGGDEFVVMLEDLSQEVDDAARQVELVAEKILNRLNAPYELAGRRHSSSPSIGITLFAGAALGVEELLKRADVAMYQAKAAGRNTLRFFDPTMQAAVLARSVMDADLRLGLQREELRLYYQPIVDGGAQVVGYEALLRWQHPQRGLVSPGEFIPVAEQSGLILPMGEWVLRAACRQLVQLTASPASSGVSISVNVSARQFRQKEFTDQVLSVLAETGADAQWLKLELTESLLLSDVEDAIRKMSVLREHGVRFALDDFGTGYSSLSYLKRLPLDQIKIDQTFVRDVLTDPNDAAIVRTILALAASMDLVAVAEGVETEGQRRFLLDNGCTVFQGYLFGKPAPLGQPSVPA